MSWLSFRKLMSSKTKSTKKQHKRAVTPLVMQMHLTECGAACLGSVLAYFGRWIPLNELRITCGVNRDGSTAAGLARAGREYGLKCSGRNVNAHHLTNMPVPQILFWEWNHFLILEGFDGQSVHLNDPAMGRRKLSMDEFEKGFSGIALQFEPGPNFQPGGTPPGMSRRLSQWIQGSGSSLAYCLACGLMMVIATLAAPVALNLFVDRVLNGTYQWGVLAATALAAAAVLVFILSWLKQRCLKRLSVRMSIEAGHRCLSKLLRLPVEFFNHRLTGDLTDRILSIDRISKGIQNYLFYLVVELAMGAVILAVMLVYSPLLTLIVLALAVLGIFATYLVARSRVEENHLWRHEQSKLIGLGMLMLHQAENLRITAAEDGFFSRWSGQQARELTARQRFVEFGHVNAAIPGSTVILAYAAVIAVGGHQAATGQITLGTLAAFFVLTGMFLTPIGRVAEFADGWQALAIELQRLEDITESDEDARLKRRESQSRTVTLNGRLKLSGHVELRGITFGYDRSRPPLIKDFDLVIEPGQRIAVVGASGAGKSTLASLISGAYEPWSGQILFDGIPKEDIPYEVIVRSLSMVDQNPVLFSATVRENITLWNSAVPDSMLIAAARDACIHDRILERPLGYETPVDEDGGNFSGGECQRLEIARSLVSNPTVLILDEATSSLDAANEKSVDDSLRHRGVSCLVIAHRLSTIRDCDEIVVLERDLVTRGTHEELMTDDQSIYRRLILAG